LVVVVAVAVPDRVVDTPSKPALVVALVVLLGTFQPHPFRVQYL
jgi:hypothetical protein